MPVRAIAIFLNSDRSRKSVVRLPEDVPNPRAFLVKEAENKFRTKLLAEVYANRPGTKDDRHGDSVRTAQMTLRMYRISERYKATTFAKWIASNSSEWDSKEH